MILENTKTSVFHLLALPTLLLSLPPCIAMTPTRDALEAARRLPSGMENLAALEDVAASMTHIHAFSDLFTSHVVGELAQAKKICTDLEDQVTVTKDMLREKNEETQALNTIVQCLKQKLERQNNKLQNSEQLRIETEKKLYDAQIAHTTARSRNLIYAHRIGTLGGEKDQLAAEVAMHRQTSLDYEKTRDLVLPAVMDRDPEIEATRRLQKRREEIREEIRERLTQAAGNGFLDPDEHSDLQEELSDLGNMLDWETRENVLQAKPLEILAKQIVAQLQEAEMRLQEGAAIRAAHHERLERERGNGVAEASSSSILSPATLSTEMIDIIIGDASDHPCCVCNGTPDSTCPECNNPICDSCSASMVQHRLFTCAICREVPLSEFVPFTGASGIAPPLTLE